MLLSIAIANYNSGKYLGQAIESVIGQLDEKLVSEVELIVVDGGSTDDSISIIKKYEDKLGWWISEPDKGQSDAFNKAFSHARGKYLTWVNADDLMIKGSIREIVKNLKKYPKTRWFTANFLRFFNTGEVMEVNWGPHYLPRILQRPNAPVVSFGPSTIFEKKLLEELGWLDINLHFIMDLELWLRFMLNGVVQRRIN
jgi:glycosyltransferase involved in cell wall biosynthesis